MMEYKSIQKAVRDLSEHNDKVVNWEITKTDETLPKVIVIMMVIMMPN